MENNINNAGGLRKRLTLNMASNSFALGVRLFVQIATVPLFLFFWPKERYGEWILISAVPAYLTLAEIGVSTTAGNEVSMAVAAGDFEQARRSIHSTWGFIAGISIIVVLLAAGASFCLPWAKWLHLSHGAATQVAWTMLTLSAYSVMSLPIGVLAAVYRTGYRNARAAFLTNAGCLLEFGAIAVSVALFPSMLILASFMLLTRTLVLISIYLDSRRIAPDINLGIAAFSMKELKRIWRPSALFSTIRLGDGIYFQGLTLLVGGVLGPGAVVVFSTTRTLTRTIVQSATVVKHTVWPEFSYLFGAGDIGKARHLNGLALEISWLVALGLAFFLYFTAPPIMTFWTHGAVRAEEPLLGFLLLAAVLKSLGSVMAGFLEGTNRHGRFALFYLFSTCACLLCAMLLIRPLGLTGVALAMVACELLLLPLVMLDACRLLQYPVRQLLPATLRLKELCLQFCGIVNRYSAGNL